MAHRPIVAMALLWLVCGGATAAAAPVPAPVCRIEWRANADGGHDLDDRCLPALSADGKRLVVMRMESGSFTLLVLSVPGKGHILHSFSAADIAFTSEVTKTVRTANQLLERDGYRPLSAVPLPPGREFVIPRGDLELRSRDAHLEVWCGPNRIGRGRKLGALTDDELGLHQEVLTGLFLPETPTFALMKVEPVNGRGFYLPGAVEWIVVPFTSHCP